MKKEHFTEFNSKRMGLSLAAALVGIPILVYGAKLVIEFILPVTYQIHPEIVAPIVIAFIFYFNALLNERDDKKGVSMY